MQRFAPTLCLVVLSCAAPYEASLLEQSVSSTEALFEAWHPLDAPEMLAAGMAFGIADLPLQGHVTKTPWPGNHWATYLDGINYRWQGPDTLSPAEKFAKAYMVDDFVERMSEAVGIDRMLGLACTRPSQCPHGHVCAKRPGEAAGTCVERWWGICDGWSAAAIATDEPQVPVTRHGVRFYVNDIKALLSMSYVNHGGRMMGRRCADHDDMVCDAAGRATDAMARSTNPGSFHVVLANLVGLQGASFVIDRDPSYRVFNHPVSGYEVSSMTPVTSKQASALLGIGNANYPYHIDAVQWAYVQTRLQYIEDPEHFEDGPLLPALHLYEKTMALEYVLELDAAGDIIGGEWAGASKKLHPDFSWTVGSAPSFDMVEPEERAAIAELARASAVPL